MLSRAFGEARSQTASEKALNGLERIGQLADLHSSHSIRRALAARLRVSCGLRALSMSGTDLPYAADASESLSEAELQVLREQFAKEKEAGYPSVQTRFNLAWSV